MTFAEALARAAREMRGVERPDRDARWLLAAASGVARDRVTLRLADELPAEAEEAFRAMARERAAGRPVSHILGEREFYGRRFKVTPDVLDPRPETEILVERALDEPFSRVLDLGTGSGCVIVTLLAERAGARGVGADISDRAVLVAGENAAAHGVDDRAIFPVSDWFEDLGGRYDLVVSNPPYVAEAEMAGLSPELGFEPRGALTDGGDGLGAYRAIVPAVRGCLDPGGRVLLEVDPRRAGRVADMMRAAGLADVAAWPDLDGRDRVLSARAPGASPRGSSAESQDSPCVAPE